MPRINAKKLYLEIKQAKRAKMPAAGNFFSRWHCDFQLLGIGLSYFKELFTVEALRF